MRATRNCTMGEISVMAVRPHSSRNDTRTEQMAIRERHEGQRRPEHEEQDDQRADAADDRLEQDPGAVVAAARGVVERVVAGQPHGRAGHGVAAQRVAQVALDVGVVAEGVVAARTEDVRRRPSRPSFEVKARSPVEPKPATRDPGTTRLALRSSARRSSRTPGEVTVVPGVSVTTGTSGQRVAAVAVGLRDLLAGLPALATGDAEALVERLGGGAGGHHARPGSAGAS